VNRVCIIVGQSLGCLQQNGCERGTIRLFGTKVPNRPIESRRGFGMPSANISGQFARSVGQLLQNMGLRLTRLPFELTRLFLKGHTQLGKIPCQFCDRLPSEFLLLRQPARQIVDFFLDVDLKALKPAFQVITEVSSLSKQVLLELCEAPIVFASLFPEENVANFVKISTGGRIIGVRDLTFSDWIRLLVSMSRTRLAFVGEGTHSFTSSHGSRWTT
jgi:hypothetical protein